MKMFVFSVKMASANGSQSHRVIGALDVKDIRELADLINSRDFIVVEKFQEVDRQLRQLGPEILNQRVIGKVREYKDRSSNPDPD